MVNAALVSVLPEEADKVCGVCLCVCGGAVKDIHQVVNAALVSVLPEEANKVCGVCVCVGGGGPGQGSVLEAGQVQ